MFWQKLEIPGDWRGPQVPGTDAPAGDGDAAVGQGRHGGALDGTLAGPVADGPHQIETGRVVLPGVGHQGLGGVEADADAHRAAALTTALDQGEQHPLLPRRLEVGADIVPEPDRGGIVVLALAGHVRVMIHPVDPEPGDIVLVPEVLDLGAEDGLGLEDPQRARQLLIAGTGGEGLTHGPEDAAVAARGEAAAGPVLQDLFDGVGVADVAGPGVVRHPLAGADVRHVGAALALGEAGVEAAVGEAGGQVREVVQHVIGLGPQGVVPHVRPRAVHAPAQGLVGGTGRRVVQQQIGLGRAAGVHHTQVIAEEARVVGAVAARGSGEDRFEVELGLVGLAGEERQAVAVDRRQGHGVGQRPALPLRRPPGVADRIAPGQCPGHPGRGDAEQAGEDPHRPAVTVEAERQHLRRSRSSHSSATGDTGGPPPHPGASATPPSGRRSRR